MSDGDGDDDETPPRGRPGWMTDDDRAMLGSNRRRSRSYPLGIPIARPPAVIVDDDRDITDPVTLLERELTADEQRIVSGSCGEGGDPVPYAQFAKFVDRQHKFEQRRRKRDTDQAREIEALRSAVHPDTVARIDRRLKSTEKAQRDARRLVIAAVVALAGGLGGAAKLLVEGAERKGSDAEKLKQNERDLRDLRDDVRELRLELGRRSSLETDVGSLTPPLFTNQGFTP